MNDPHSPEKEMSLFEHLGELRKRLFWSALALAVGAIVSYGYISELFTFLSAPYFTAFPPNSLIGTSPAEIWLLKLKVACFAGAIISGPIIFYQIWLFILPGLHDHERKLVIPFLLLSTMLFIGGAYFCYYQVMPITMSFFFNEYTSVGITPQIKGSEAISLTITMLAAFGFVFELPLISFFLARAGLIDHKTLMSSWRAATLIIFVISAVLSPPDVLSQFLMAGPLVVLYCISIVIAKFAAREQNDP